MSNTPVKHPTRTKVFKALLVALDGDKDAALAAYNAHIANPTPIDEPTEQPVEAKVEEPKKKGKKGKKGKKAKSKKTKADQNALEALVAERGFQFTRGRVYVTPQIVEAAVRVLKTGRTEIATSSGNGRIEAVVVFATESGDAAVQNLVRA